MNLPLIRLLKNPKTAFESLEVNYASEHLFNSDILEQVISFHNSIPNYQSTPLIELKDLSKRLKLKNILVKDESQRFDLNAFKMLGASFAIAKFLATKLGLSESQVNYSEIIKHQADYKNIVFATATDGNHGRAVAWSAKLFGCHSYIYMPKGSSTIRLDAIKQYSPHAEITEMDYDDTVKYVEQQSATNDWQVIQDTAWPGYTEIPDNIMRGYFSLIHEFELQSSNQWPTHVFLQAGVGSMAAGVSAYFSAHHKPTPKIILVEPFNAPCFYQSIKINDGKAHQFGNLKTIMAGLACGIPSLSAWEILKNQCEYFLTCDDQLTLDGMRRYAHPVGSDQKIKSGESGAVTLGVAERIMSSSKLETCRKDLELNENAIILLLSTEGDTDPEFYQRTIRGKT